MQRIVSTGFAPDVRLVPWLTEQRLSGVDRSRPDSTDLDAFEADSPHRGLNIQTMGGDEQQRRAVITADPATLDRQALCFEIRAANEASALGKKGRVQCCLYGTRRYTALTQQVRLYLDGSLCLLRGWSQQATDMLTNWFIVQEYWFAPGWLGGPYPFRISLSLYWNPAEHNRIHFLVHGQPGNPDPTATGYGVWLPATWEQVQRDYTVPLGRWLTLRTSYRMGDAGSGRFTYEVREDGASWETIFAIADWTYSPLSPVPVPLQHFNPIKLYTSGEVVDFLRSHGGCCRCWWSDLCIDALPADPASALQSVSVP